MSRPTQIHINGQALQHNLQRVREYAPHSQVLAVIKADAYGHGIVNVAEYLGDADALAVACLSEAQALRAAGVTQRLVLLEGFFSASELTEIERLQLEIVLHSKHQLAILEQARLKQALKVWLKINTGMNRLGFALADTQSIWARTQACRNIAQTPVLMTHLACAEQVDNDFTQRQYEFFMESIGNLPGARSIANSAGLIAHSYSQADWVRPGLMLYGVSPFAERTAKDLGLKPVMQFHSKIVAIQECVAGDAIGYGGRYVCPATMRIGIIPVGYADGYPWSAPDATPVLVDGHPVPLAGRVSMDRLTVDLRQVPDAQIGSEVVLWGEGLPVETIAAQCQTLPYELLCRAQTRVAE